MSHLARGPARGAGIDGKAIAASRRHLGVYVALGGPEAAA
jgi:hypothetical protein